MKHLHPRRPRIRPIATAFLVAAAAALSLATPAAAATKVTICHATGSQSNPYVSVTAAAAGIVNGHIDHQHQEDIIPPFTHNNVQYSQNWDAEGQAIFNADCETDVPSPTTTPIPVFPNVLSVTLASLGAVGAALLFLSRRV